MIGPFNSQFSGNYLALCMGLQKDLFCNAALAGPPHFSLLTEIRLVQAWCS